MFETYLSFVDRLSRFDTPDLEPGRLVGLAKELPLSAGVALVVAGAIACLAGGRRHVFRLVLAPIAITIAWAMGPKIAQHVHLAPKLASYAAAGAAGLASVVWPPLVVFAVFGAIGASVGGELAGPQEYWIGVVPGFLLGGVLSIALHRFISVVVSSVLGATALVLGLLTLVSFTRLAPLAFSAPVLLLGLIGCVTVGALAFQFKFPPPTDEEREKERAERMEARQRKADAKVREKRFKKYDKRAADAEK